MKESLHPSSATNPGANQPAACTGRQSAADSAALQKSAKLSEKSAESPQQRAPLIATHHPAR